MFLKAFDYLQLKSEDKRSSLDKDPRGWDTLCCKTSKKIYDKLTGVAPHSDLSWWIDHIRAAVTLKEYGKN